MTQTFKTLPAKRRDENSLMKQNHSVVFYTTWVKADNDGQKLPTSLWCNFHKLQRFEETRHRNPSLRGTSNFIVHWFDNMQHTISNYAIVGQ